MGETNKLQRKPGQNLYCPTRISGVKASLFVSDCRKLVWLEISLCCHSPLLQLINVAPSFYFCPLAGKKENYSFRKHWIKADECKLMILFSAFFFFFLWWWALGKLSSRQRLPWWCSQVEWMNTRHVPGIHPQHAVLIGKIILVTGVQKYLPHSFYWRRKRMIKWSLALIGFKTQFHYLIFRVFN